MSVESLFLQFSVDKLKQFTDRIEICLKSLTEDQIWARGGENENAIGNLALHLTGNVRQWIITSLGNDPMKRDRDSEFSARGGRSSAELTTALRDTVDRAARIVAGLGSEQLTRTYEIQNYSVSGVEVVYHVVEHFAQHTGQIIFATKILAGNDLGFYRHLRHADATENAMKEAAECAKAHRSKDMKFSRLLFSNSVPMRRPPSDTLVGSEIFV